MIYRTEPSAAARIRRSRNLCSRLFAGLGWLVFLVLASLPAPAAFAAGPSANSLYKRGQTAEARQDYDTAFEDYQRAYQKNPKDLRYETAFYRVRISASAAHVSQGRKLFQSGDIEGALAEFLHASEIDPGNEEAQQEIARVREKQEEVAPTSEAAIPQLSSEAAELASIGSPPQLKPLTYAPIPLLHMTEDTKVIYQAIGKAAGINVLFDPDLNSKRISVELNNVSLLDALRIVGTMSNTFWRPVTSNTIFVATNSRAKRTELDEQAVQTFYLANAWQQNDLNDVQTAIRNLMPNTKVYAVQSQNAIVMRGTPDELLLAQQLVSDLDKPRPEVVVDMAVLEVSKNWERTLGIEWPSSVGVALTPPCTSSNCSSSTSSTTGTTGTTSSTSPTLYNLAHLKASDFAVTIGSATLNLLLTDTDTQILQDPRLRATDGQKAAFKVGSKIPIATGSYQTGAATALVSSLVNTQFQYEDVGVDVEMTPSVHYDNDVTLKLKITVSAQSGSVTISGVTEPILSQRVVDQVIRLHEGEASLIGGIQDNSDSQSWTGIPGLSSIPILKYIFGSKDHTITKDEIVFVVVPHIVRSPDIQQRNLRVIDTGTGQSIDLRHLDVDNAAPAPAPEVKPTALDQQPAQQPVRQPAPGPAFTAAVPSQSAEIAAPIALAQMRSNLQQSMSPPPTAPPVQPPVQPTATAQPTAPPAAQPAARPASAQPVMQETAQTVRPPGTPQVLSNQTAPAAPGVQAGAPNPGRPGGAATFSFNPPPGTVNNGASFQVPVVLNGGVDVSLVPLQIHYDPAKLSLVNVSSGNLLNRDGQPATVIHTEDGKGGLTVVASRPPHTPGVSGGGTVCVLTFQAKAAGTTGLTFTSASFMNSTQQQVQGQGAQTTIVVK
ncbi:MAG TPA: cohesin domain-containing protein [Terracidiphilus sp.]|nr:cohesin domain-containing protein [Terracidiphilus sp.]